MFILIFFLLNLLSFRIYADGQNAETPKLETVNPCINDMQYEDIIRRCKQNTRILSDGITRKHSDEVTLLSLPMTEENYFVSCYVDNDPARGSISEFSCGTHTYDGHTGTDISIWPFTIADQAAAPEVIAAAAGIIIDKSDGILAIPAKVSYIVVQHYDGSCAVYWNLAINSVTGKAIGQKIETGEYLGIAGNSSTGPQLHFEVWKEISNTTFVDPYFHRCQNSVSAGGLLNPDHLGYTLKLE